jgi:hypothetical protein
VVRAGCQLVGRLAGDGQAASSLMI